MNLYAILSFFFPHVVVSLRFRFSFFFFEAFYPFVRSLSVDVLLTIAFYARIFFVRPSREALA